MNVRGRIGRLEERSRAGLPSRWDESLWPASDQLAAVVDAVDFHAAFGTAYECTDRELGLLEGAGVLEEAGGHVRRMDPARQKRREGWLFERRHGFEPWREKVRRVEEETRAFEGASRQSDRELLERNRASVGLPALNPEQIGEWGLEDTTWEGTEDAEG